MHDGSRPLRGWADSPLSSASTASRGGRIHFDTGISRFSAVHPVAGVGQATGFRPGIARGPETLGVEMRHRPAGLGLRQPHHVAVCHPDLEGLVHLASEVLLSHRKHSSPISSTSGTTASARVNEATSASCRVVDASIPRALLEAAWHRRITHPRPDTPLAFPSDRSEHGKAGSSRRTGTS